MNGNNQDFRDGYNNALPDRHADMDSYNRGKNRSMWDRAMPQQQSESVPAGAFAALFALIATGALIWFYAYYIWAALASLPVMVLLVRYALTAPGSRPGWGGTIGDVTVAYLVAMAAIAVLWIVALVVENFDGGQIVPMWRHYDSAFEHDTLRGWVLVTDSVLDWTLPALVWLGAAGIWLTRALGPLRVSGAILRFAVIVPTLALAYALGLGIAELVRTA